MQNTYNPSVTGIYASLDGKIESFFGNVNPAGSWSPGDYARHVGDMWYNTTYKFLFRFGGADSNDWHRIEDADAVAAYEIALQAKDTVDGKRTTFIVVPYPPYQAGDLWVDGTHLRNCITNKVAGQSFNINDWVYSTAYDRTKTVIDGGLVTTGTIQLAGSAGSVLAGITGADDGFSAIRIWSGASFENRYTAPFRVNQIGEVVARRKIEVQDENNVGQAGIAGSMQSTDGIIRIWAGTDYANRNSAPFKVDANGWVYASRGYIGNLRISNGYLTNDANGDSGVFIANAVTQRTAAIGTAVLSTTAGLNPVAYFSVTTPKDYDDNIAAVFEAEGANANNFKRNYAIFVPKGIAMLSDSIINGMQTFYRVGGNSSFNDDPTKYNQIAINPTGGVSNVNFTGSGFTLGLGKFMFISNIGNAGIVRLNGIVRSSVPVYDLGAGVSILIVNTGAGWHVVASYQNSY